MTDLDQLTNELARVKSRETDPLYELAFEDEATKSTLMPMESDKTGKFLDTSKGVKEEIFSITCLASDQELARFDGDVKKLIEIEFVRGCQTLASEMGKAGYVPYRSSIVFEQRHNQKLLATELFISTSGVAHSMDKDELKEVNFVILTSALRNRNER